MSAHHFAALYASTCPPCHLEDQLERPLRRSEIRQVQRRVCAHYSNQTYVRIVQPLRHHLRAYQHLRSSGAETFENLHMRVLAPGGVNIEPCNFDAREVKSQLALHLPVPTPKYLMAFTLRAPGRLNLKSQVAFGAAGNDMSTTSQCRHHNVPPSLPG